MDVMRLWFLSDIVVLVVACVHVFLQLIKSRLSAS